MCPLASEEFRIVYHVWRSVRSQLSTLTDLGRNVIFLCIFQCFVALLVGDVLGLHVLDKLAWQLGEYLLCDVLSTVVDFEGIVRNKVDDVAFSNLSVPSHQITIVVIELL